MITPQIIPSPERVTAKVNAADLSALIAAVSASNVIALPAGKTLSDVTNLNLNVLPHALPDGTAAIINAQL